MMQRTIEVAHPDSHEPTADQIDKAVKAELKADGLKLQGDYSLSFRSGSSGQSSKYVVTFEADEAPKAKKVAAKKVDESPVVSTDDVAVTEIATDG